MTATTSPSTTTTTMTMPQLPVELLGRIFVECLPNEDPYVSPDARQAPVLLMLVCRRWMQIATRTPQLWRSLCAAVDAEEMGLEYMREERMGAYANWLARSGACPLWLQVSFDGSGMRREEWLQLLRRYRGRFERLRVVDGFGLDVNLLVHDARMLRHLTIEARFGQAEDDDLPGDISLTQPHPPLQTLVVDFLRVSQGTLSSPGWANLTGLAVRLTEGESYATEEFLRLIDCCPKLEGLVFGPVSIGNHEPRPRLHPNLRFLTVSFEYGEEVEDPSVSKMLILPRLRSLRVPYALRYPDLEYELMADLEPEYPTDSSGEQSQEQPPATGMPGRLCSIEVEGSDPGFDAFDLRWTNLTRLEVHFSGDGDVLQKVLGLCPSIRELYVAGKHCSVGSTSFPTPFALPMLSSLEIVVLAELGNFLSMATLPSLRNLSVVSTGYGEREDVRSFLVRSRCPLERLEVIAKNSTAWTEEELTELASLVPTLSYVNLNGFRFN